MFVIMHSPDALTHTHRMAHSLKTEASDNEAILKDMTNKAAPAISELNKVKINNRELSGNLAAVESELRVCRNEMSSLRQEVSYPQNTDLCTEFGLFSSSVSAC